MLLLEKVRAAEIPRPSQYRAGVPVELEEIVMKALAKDPSHRFQSGYEFQRALTEYLHRRSPGVHEQPRGAHDVGFVPRVDAGAASSAESDDQPRLCPPAAA